MSNGFLSKIKAKVPIFHFDTKKLIIFLLPYLFIGYVMDKLFWLYRHMNGGTAFWKIISVTNHLDIAFQSPLPSIHPLDILAGVAAALAFHLARYLHDKDKKNFRAGEEYGSARWGNAKDIEPYVDAENPDNNIILTQTERLTMSPYGKLPKYSRNKNVLIIGGSGSGKTRFFVKPNLLQCHSSYVVTDPKGYTHIEQRNNDACISK